MKRPPATKCPAESTLDVIGGRVSNDGTIEAAGGRVGLASGEQVSVDVEGDGFLTVSVPTRDEHHAENGHTKHRPIGTRIAQEAADGTQGSAAERALAIAVLAKRGDYIGGL